MAGPIGVDALGVNVGKDYFEYLNSNPQILNDIRNSRLSSIYTIGKTTGQQNQTLVNAYKKAQLNTSVYGTSMTDAYKNIALDRFNYIKDYFKNFRTSSIWTNGEKLTQTIGNEIKNTKIFEQVKRLNPTGTGVWSKLNNFSKTGAGRATLFGLGILAGSVLLNGIFGSKDKG